MQRVEFTVSGESGKERAESLWRLYERWRENPLPLLHDTSSTGPRIRITITDPKRETSVEHAVMYARNELKDRIGEAGGFIWDGTHVQITTDEG